MAKIIVVIENTEDGQPIWDEASIKQLHDIIRPGARPNHHGKCDERGDLPAHNSSHQQSTGDGDNSRYSTATSTKVKADANRDLGADFIAYEFEA